MKLKREVQDLRPDFLSVPAALPPPQLLFQHHLLSGQLPASGGFYAQLQPLHRAPLPAPMQQQHRCLSALLPPPHHFY